MGLLHLSPSPSLPLSLSFFLSLSLSLCLHRLTVETQQAIPSFLSAWIVELLPKTVATIIGIGMSFSRRHRPFCRVHATLYATISVHLIIDRLVMHWLFGVLRAAFALPPLPNCTGRMMPHAACAHERVCVIVCIPFLISLIIAAALYC